MCVARVLLGCCLALLAVLGGCSSAIKPDWDRGPPPPYEFTIVDPLAATVVGTPPGFTADVPEGINRDELTLSVFPERAPPTVFWYADKLAFSLVYQVGPAPLVFLIAGTGAGHDSAKSKYLQQVLFQAGYHVISLPSPTAADFIIAASSTGVPGRAEDDAGDLYRVMKLAYEQVKDRIQVQSFHLTGYSLGAWDAAFVAYLDSQEKAFGFDKVLLINPPVSLYTSAQILDGMLDDNIAGGSDNIGAYLGRVIHEIAKFYQTSDDINFTTDYLLYTLYTKLEPSDIQLESLIGLAFRFSSANLVFTSDVMTSSGMMVPANLRLGTATSLSDYMEISIRTSFIQFFDDLYYPYFRARDPSITRQDLIDQASLESIGEFLAGAQNIGLMTNEDDVILSPGQIEYLEELFGDRAQIWPTGGHMGNLRARAVTAYVADFFGR